MSRDEADVSTYEVESLSPRLDRIAEQLAGIQVSLESVRVSLAGLSDMTRDQENRLRQMEAWTHKLSPWLALLTFLAGGLATRMLEAWFG